jgi:hypothetical protein
MGQNLTTCTDPSGTESYVLETLDSGELLVTRTDRDRIGHLVGDIDPTSILVGSVIVEDTDYTIDEIVDAIKTGTPEITIEAAEILHNQDVSLQLRFDNGYVSWIVFTLK